MVLIKSVASLSLMFSGFLQPGSIPGPITVSHGEQIVLEQHLMPERPTVFVFFQGTSTAEKAVVGQVVTNLSANPTTGVRLIELPTLTCPAARQFEIHETPLMMVVDRFGRLTKRTSALADLQPAIDSVIHLARLKWINEDDPMAAEAYRAMGGGKSHVAEILKTMSLRPDLMMLIARTAQTGHFVDGYLPHKTKEMIATYVSSINHCKY